TGALYPSFEWRPGSYLDDSTKANPLATPAGTATVFELKVTDQANGCQARDMVTVYVSPEAKPTVSLGQDIFVCIEGNKPNTLQIGLTPIPGYIYLWTGSTSILSDVHIANPYVNLNNPAYTNLTLTVTNPFNSAGCNTNSDDMRLYVYETDISFFVEPQEICPGDSVVLSPNPSFEPYYWFMDYSWSPPTGLSADSIENPVASPSATTMYTFTANMTPDPYYNYIGCTFHASGVLTVNTPPQVPNAAVEVICGTLAERKVQIFPHPGYTYHWEPAALVSDPAIANPYFLGTSNTMLTLSITDNKGCTNEGPVFCTLGDEQPPVLFCPGDTVLNCDSDTSTNTLGVALAIDNCDPYPVLAHTDRVIPLGCAGHRLIRRTWYAFDSLGNIDSCTQLITMQDTLAPLINGPAHQVMNCPADTSVQHTGIAGAADYCDAIPIVTYADVVIPGCGNSFVVQRIWRATDNCGNYSEFLQIITVKDTIPPLIYCPVDVVRDCPADTSVAANGTPSISDDCSFWTLSSSDEVFPGCGNSFSVERTWLAIDACGNFAECIQVIQVQDTTAPLIQCTNVLNTADYGHCDELVYPPQPIVSDECSSITLTNDRTGTDDATDIYPAGTTLVTWILTDACGNQSSCVQTVTVRNYPVAADDDTIVPTGATVVFPVLQ
ncbi:MAG TPA: HYR domain-containing protein, partial [Bacteroidales bacterium]|nr:HYR domain-containing protein [Bacteroidales bacterium]